MESGKRVKVMIPQEIADELNKHSNGIGMTKQVLFILVDYLNNAHNSAITVKDVNYGKHKH